jgi:hypothetical protein
MDLIDILGMRHKMLTTSNFGFLELLVLYTRIKEFLLSFVTCASTQEMFQIKVMDLNKVHTRNMYDESFLRTFCTTLFEHN